MMEKLFLNIGAMKAGTTWIYALISKHPEIHFTFEKELHYFSHMHSGEAHLNRKYQFDRFMKAMNRVDPDYTPLTLTQKKLRWYADYLLDPKFKGWYERLFDGVPNSKYCADFSNHYAILPDEGWEHVKRTAQNIKISYILRHPVERLWSHAKFHAKQTGTLETFYNKTPKEHLEFAKTNHIWRNGQYAKTIKSLNKHFSKEQVQISFFDEIHQNPLSWLRGLEDFLSIDQLDYKQSDLNKKINTSAPDLMPHFFPSLFADDLAEEIKSLEELGYNPPASWAHPVDTQPSDIFAEKKRSIRQTISQNKNNLTRMIKTLRQKR